MQALFPGDRLGSPVRMRKKNVAVRGVDRLRPIIGDRKAPSTLTNRKTYPVDVVPVRVPSLDDGHGPLGRDIPRDAVRSGDHLLVERGHVEIEEALEVHQRKVTLPARSREGR